MTRHQNHPTNPTESDGLHKLLVESDALCLSGLENLLVHADNCYRDVANKQAAVRDPHPDTFNIFTLTGRADLEVTTHQRVLGDLLNPLGTHRQGNFFLKPFLDLVMEKTRIQLAHADGLWEKDRKYNIDVRLSHPNSGDRVIIETKWNHEDYEGQVDGYWREERKRARRPRIPVLFITKTGCNPKVTGDAHERALFNADLICLSWFDIASLLEHAIQDVKAPRVCEVLQQYIDLLKLSNNGEGGAS